MNFSVQRPALSFGTHSVSDFGISLFLFMIADRGLVHTSTFSRVIEPQFSLPETLVPLWTYHTKKAWRFVGQHRSGLIYLRIEENKVVGHIAAETLEHYGEVTRDIHAVFTDARPHTSNEVLFKFWNSSPQGAVSRTRRLVVPSWPDIAGNYQPSVRDSLETVCSWREPAYGGQLLLFHGAPGTGKTYMIRAMAQSWRSWCSFEYITDPEVLLSTAPYLNEVLMGESTDDDSFEEDDDDYNVSRRHLVQKKEPGWRFLIMEDTGELLSADARERSGQGLSRLLNVVDGLIGQGLRILILITTNEELGKLHPAISRPGRCLARILFTSLDAETANYWLHEKGSHHRVDHAHTIAELFSMLHDQQTTQPPRSVGFIPKA